MKVRERNQLLPYGVQMINIPLKGWALGLGGARNKVRMHVDNKRLPGGGSV